MVLLFHTLLCFIIFRFLLLFQIRVDFLNFTSYLHNVGEMRGASTNIRHFERRCGHASTHVQLLVVCVSGGMRYALA